MSKHKAGRAAAEQADKLARRAIAAERAEEARAAGLLKAVGQARALTTMDEPPLDGPAAPFLAPPDTTRVLKEAPRSRRALLIINAKSGPDASSLQQTRALVELLAAHGLGVDVRVKLRKSLARRDARRAAGKGYPLVIAAGGDGTVAAVARGLLDAATDPATDAPSNTALGIIPLGTYNNLATSLGIPRDLPAACALIALGVTRQVDVGEVQVARGKRKAVPFFEIASVGLAAALAPSGQHLEKGRWEQARQSLPAALGMEPTFAAISLDGAPPQAARTLLVVVANSPRAGAGLTLAPQARMDDGLLNVQVYDDVDQAGLAARLVAAQAGGAPLADQAERAHARMVRIDTQTPLPVAADSKVVGVTPATFRLRPGALRVVVGDGDGLARPVSPALVTAATAAAQALSSAEAAADEGASAVAAEHAETLPVRALATLVPVAGQVAERVQRSGPRTLPLVAAAAAGALLVPALRALTRRPRR